MLITYTEYANMISESVHNNIIGRVGYEALPGRPPRQRRVESGAQPLHRQNRGGLLVFPVALPKRYQYLYDHTRRPVSCRHSISEP